MNLLYLKLHKRKHQTQILSNCVFPSEINFCPQYANFPLICRVSQYLKERGDAMWYSSQIWSGASLFRITGALFYLLIRGGEYSWSWMKKGNNKSLWQKLQKANYNQDRNWIQGLVLRLRTLLSTLTFIDCITWWGWLWRHKKMTIMAIVNYDDDYMLVSG